MISTLDIMDLNATHLIMRGMETAFISMPVLHYNEEGELCLACFAWEAKRKQRNVPKPEYVVITSVSNTRSVKIMEPPECGLPDICISKPISFWTQRALARDLDSIIEEYLTTGEVDEYEYYYYLENMLKCYDEEYYPLFKKLNMPTATIDLLK